MGLRVTLICLALYTGVFGLLFLLGQDLAAALLEITIYDPVPFRQWGAALLTLALLAALLASNPVRYRRLLLIAVLGLPLSSLALVYDLLSGASSLRQHGIPLAINLVLFALLLRFYPRGPEAVTEEPTGPAVAEERWLPFLRRKAPE